MSRRGNRRHNFRRCNDDGPSTSRNNENPYPSRPPGLRGKEIGLFYRDQARKREHCQSNNPKTGIKLTIAEGHIRRIKTYLDSCSSAPFCENKRPGSYNHISESEFKKKFLYIINSTIEHKLENSNITVKQRHEGLDETYFNELEAKKKSSTTYKTMMETRIKLPSYEKRDEIIKLINENQVVVISGETGCGKTTQVAQFILDYYIENKQGSLCKIVCTQPRRISAISIAERVAKERGEKCGNSVGFQIRLEKNLPRPNGSVLFCTTGVLLKQMETDPCLHDISHLILDEIHERDIITDFLITLLKQVLETRKDLKLILMSATLNSEQFSKYYNNCIHMTIPGFTYPVTEYYLEDVLNRINFTFPVTEVSTPKNWKKHLKNVKQKIRNHTEYGMFIEPYIRELQSNRSYDRSVCENLCNANSEKLNHDLILKLIIRICTNEPMGAILVFLPGFADISLLHKKLLDLTMFQSSKYWLIPLHSKMPSIEQKSIFEEPPSGVRKIVLSTNIAETSITINDVVYVIDCGKIKIKNYDVQTHVQSLDVEWVSSANADQRKGRAGRVKPGSCFHLFTRARNMTFEKYTKPEILRTRLENVVLSIKILQLGNVQSFLSRVMDPPPEKTIQKSLVVLKRMNALDNEECLTPLGYHLARLPMNPQMGKMALLGALFGCLDPILSIAASLDFKDAFQLPLGKEHEVDKKKRQLLPECRSDHMMLHEALNRYEKAKRQGYERKFCWEYFLSSQTLELLINMKKQFAEYLCDLNFISDSYVKNPQWNRNSDNLSLVRAIICAGLYPNVAVIKKINKMSKKIITFENQRVELHPGSVNSNEKVFVSRVLVYHSMMKSTKLFLYDTTMVHSLPLLFFGDSFQITEERGYHVIVLNQHIKFKCDENTAFLIKDLRSKLNDLLEYKISHPGIVNWNENSDEVALLSAVIELLTIEDCSDITFCSSDDDDYGEASYSDDY